MQQAPEAMTLKVIAHIHTAFPTKFGIPRQSGLVEELRGEIVFTPEYRNPDALRGLEDFSHIWLVWQFSYYPVNQPFCRKCQYNSDKNGHSQFLNKHFKNYRFLGACRPQNHNVCFLSVHI